MSDAWVNDYVGVPYLVNGRDRSGWDCWGLIVVAFKEQRDIVLPDWRVSTTRDHLGELAEAVTVITRGVREAVRCGNAQRIEAAEPWAIVTVQRRHLPNHVGVMVGNYVLHCAEKTAGTVCEPLQVFEARHGVPHFWRWLGS